MYSRYWGARVAEEAAEVEWEQRKRDFWIGESPSSLPYIFTFWWLSCPWVSSLIPQILQLLFHVFLHLCLDYPERCFTASFPIATQSPKISFLIYLFFNLLFWKDFSIKKTFSLRSTSKLFSHHNMQRLAGWSIVIFWQFFLFIQSDRYSCIESLSPCFGNFFSSII